MKALNWKEIALLAEACRSRVDGLFLDQVIVPSRPHFVDGYIKGEWVMRFSGAKKECALLFSLRPRRAYLAPYANKGPTAAPQSTQSAFLQAVSKHLRGMRLDTLAALPRERIVVIWFKSRDENARRLGLVTSFIPATPEAFLVEEGETGWPILAWSRASGEKTRAGESFIPPSGERAPPEVEIRPELAAQPDGFIAELERELEAEAFSSRLARAERALRDLHRQAEDRRRQSETALCEAERESDWQHYGDLLKGSLGNPVAVTLPDGKNAWRAMDYTTGEKINVPSDPKLNIQEQLAKFYSLARRKSRRIEEARARMEQFGEKSARMGKLLGATPGPGNWRALEEFEREAQLPSPGGDGAPSEKKRKGGTSWLGKTFTSKDGLPIWVGRSRDENLELTFKCARGNDLWLHVRGRPGAHVIVPLPAAKTAPLETLLDAATLAVYYSGGEKWGKTEVDYTFKKYVKRIRDSTEASYVNNKTLIVEMDAGRMKRLLGS